MIVQGSDDRNDSKVGIEKLSSGIINNRVPLTNLARNERGSGSLLFQVDSVTQRTFQSRLIVPVAHRHHPTLLFADVPDPKQFCKAMWVTEKSC